VIGPEYLECSLLLSNNWRALQHTAFLLRALVIGFPVFIQLEALPGYGSARFDVIGKLKGLLLPVHGLLEIAGLSVGGSERAEVCGILEAV
jgi:hypothetical protein